MFPDDLRVFFLPIFDNQINKDGVKRKFYPGDTLPLWHEEIESVNSLLDIVPAASPDPMVSLE